MEVKPGIKTTELYTPLLAGLLLITAVALLVMLGVATFEQVRSVFDTGMLIVLGSLGIAYPVVRSWVKISEAKRIAATPQIKSEQAPEPKESSEPKSVDGGVK